MRSVDREKILRDTLERYPPGTVAGFDSVGELIVQPFRGEREEDIEPVIQWIQAMARTPSPESNAISVVVDKALIDESYQLNGSSDESNGWSQRRSEQSLPEDLDRAKQAFRRLTAKERELFLAWISQHHLVQGKHASKPKKRPKKKDG